MSEVPSNPVGSGEECKDGPDLFSFYAREIGDLLSEYEDILCNSNVSEISQGNYRLANGMEAVDCSPKDPASLFENSIGAGLSDLKKGRLKALLRQSANDLSMEVDEMLEPVLRMCRLQTMLKSNNPSKAASNNNAAKDASKKPKMMSSSSSNSTANSCPINSAPCEEMEADLQFLLKNHDQQGVKEMVKKHSDDLSSRLLLMEQRLEQTLDTIMSKCRPMSLIEKRRLQKLIQKLPQENLARIAEIIQRGRPAGKPCVEEIFVNLEQEGDVTLWRLYYYVEAVEKAKILAQSQCSTNSTS